MSGPTPYSGDGQELFTEARPAVVILGDLLDYIQEMRRLYDDTQELYQVLQDNLSFIGSGSPKGVYASLSALQTAKPTGDQFIYVTTDNGNWYYWNGSAWTSGGVYQATFLSPNTVTNRYLAPNVIDYFKHSPYIPITFKNKPKNLYNKKTVTNGYYVKYSDGTLATNASYTASDFIYVKGGSTYTLSKRDQSAWYDSDKKYISGISAGADITYTVTAPTNASYIKISSPTTGIDTLMFEEGSTASVYEPFFTDLLLDASQYLKAGSINDTLIGSDFKEKMNRVIEPYEIIAKKLNNPTQSVQIKLLGDSITQGVGGTGYAETGDTIPGTTVKMNPDGYCWANSFAKLLTSKYGGSKTFLFNDKYIDLKTTAFITNSGNYQFNNLIPNSTLLNFSFKSDELKIITTTYANGGKVDLYIDGVLHSTLDSYSPTLTQNVETTISLPFGKHTATLKATNTKNSASGGYLFTLQGFKINRKIIVLNYAQSGKNSSQIYTQRDTLIDVLDDYVIMQLGTNDRHNLASPEETKRYQRGIVDTAYSKGAQVILMSACPSTVSGDNDPIRKYGMYDVDRAIRELAYEYNMNYISNYDGFLEFAEYRNINMDTLLSDGLHPNDTGYDVMFRNIVRKLNLHYVRNGVTK